MLKTVGLGAAGLWLLIMMLLEWAARTPSVDRPPLAKRIVRRISIGLTVALLIAPVAAFVYEAETGRTIGEVLFEKYRERRPLEPKQSENSDPDIAVPDSPTSEENSTVEIEDQASPPPSLNLDDEEPTDPRPIENEELITPEAQCPIVVCPEGVELLSEGTPARSRSNNVNLRAGPSTSYESYGKASRDVLYRTLGRQDSWRFVRYKTDEGADQWAWMWGTYLSEGEEEPPRMFRDFYRESTPVIPYSSPRVVGYRNVPQYRSTVARRLGLSADQFRARIPFDSAMAPHFEVRCELEFGATSNRTIVQVSTARLYAEAGSLPNRRVTHVVFSMPLTGYDVRSEFAHSCRYRIPDRREPIYQ